MDTQFHQIIFPIILQAEDYAILSVQCILKNGFHATKSFRHNNSERKGTFLSEIIYPYFFFLFLYVSKHSSVIYPKWLSEFLIRGTQERIPHSSILRIHMLINFCWHTVHRLFVSRFPCLFHTMIGYRFYGIHFLQYMRQIVRLSILSVTRQNQYAQDSPKKFKTFLHSIYLNDYFTNSFIFSFKICLRYPTQLCITLRSGEIST